MVEGRPGVAVGYARSGAGGLPAGAALAAIPVAVLVWWSIRRPRKRIGGG